MNWQCLLTALFLCATCSSVMAAETAAESQRVELTGILIPGGVECQLFEADNGEKYTLIGDLKGLKNGDRVRLSGEIVMISFCMQGTTLSVDQIEKIDPG